MATRAPKVPKIGAAEVTKQKVVNLLVGTIGSMTDSYFALRQKKAELNEEIKLLDAKMEELEGSLIERLDAEGSARGSGQQATCSVVTATVYNAVDWAKIEAYIKKTSYFHLFQRRLSVEAVREVVQQSGKLVPGTEPFTKRRINVRSL